MAQPKKQTTKRRTGSRRSHLATKLQRIVNRTSPVKVVYKKHKAALPKVKKDSAQPKKQTVSKSGVKSKTKKPPTNKSKK